MKRMPDYLARIIRERELKEADEERLRQMRRNPPDELVIPTGDGKLLRFRVPKVRPGPRRRH
jgi:hypothetical protein